MVCVVSNNFKMPVVRENRENSLKSPLSDDLSLQGDKIKLESRPVSREPSTASAKCAYLLQGPLRSARPVSTIPLLLPYENKIFRNQKRRPYSAEDIKVLTNSNDKVNSLHLDSSTLLHKLTNSCSSLQGIEEIDKDFYSSLPSTNLLKTLLDEPVPIWQNNHDCNSTSNSIRHSMDPCCSKESSRLSSEQSPHDHDLRSELTPGLTSKPPRAPSKDEIKRPNTVHSETENKRPATTSELDIKRSTITFDDKRTQLDMSDLEKKTTQHEEFSSKTRKADSENKLKYAHGAIKKTPSIDCVSVQAKTNIYLMDLMDINRTSKTIKTTVSDPGQTLTKSTGDNATIANLNISDNEKMYKELLEKIDLEQREFQRSNFEYLPSSSNISESKTKSKEVVQLFSHSKMPFGERKQNNSKQVETSTVNNKSPKKSKKDTFAQKRKPVLLVTKPQIRHSSKGKFVAKPMKLEKDFDDEIKGPLEETESWMSTNRTSTSSNSQNLKDDTLADVQEMDQKGSSNTLFSLSNDNLAQGQSVPNKEVESENSHGASSSSLSREMNLDHDNLNREFDQVSNTSEMDQILDVLEQETQRSHLQIQSIKEIVSKELNASFNSIRPTIPLNMDQNGSESNRLEKISKFTIYKPQRTSFKDSNVENHTLQTALYNEISFYDREYRQKTNFQDILHFLDEVDRSHTESISKAKQCVDMSNNLISNLMHLELVPKLEDLLKHTPNELALLIVELHACIMDKTSSIKLLHEEIADLREEKIRAPLQVEKSMKEKLKAQKLDLDKAIKRHQKFIDQLVADKQELSDQCEGLLQEMKTRDERYTFNMKALEHKHSVELKKAKEMKVCAEKARRERWIDSKTQKIKELTVKSIEPELHAMAERHEQELTRVRRNFQNEIEELSLDHARKSEHQMITMREEFMKEREQALIQERDHQREMYKAMLEDQERNYHDERKRMFREQQQRIKECEEREKLAYIERDNALELAKKDFETRIDMLDAKHSQEIELIREQANFDFEQWKLSFIKEMTANKQQEERTLREELRRERDKEIEAVIERFEKAAQEAQMKAEEDAERRVQVAKGGSKFEMDELKLSESYYKEKFNEHKELINNYEAKISTLTANVHQLQYVTTVYQDKLDTQAADAAKIQDELQNEIISMGLQLESQNIEKQEELNEVYARVRTSITNKEQQLLDSQRECNLLKERIAQLETIGK